MTSGFAVSFHSFELPPSTCSVFYSAWPRLPVPVAQPEPRIRVSRGGMRSVRALPALEIDFSNAVAVGVAGHLVRLVSSRVSVGSVSGMGSETGGSAGPLSSGGAASAFGWKLFIQAQAFTSVPSTEKCSSDRSGTTSRCARIAAMTLRDISVLSRPLKTVCKVLLSGRDGS